MRRGNESEGEGGMRRGNESEGRKANERWDREERGWNEKREREK